MSRPYNVLVQDIVYIRDFDRIFIYHLPLQITATAHEAV